MLNVLTPNGRKYEDNTREILFKLSEKINIDFCFFPPESPSFVDGFVSFKDKLVSVFEAKYRNASYDSGKMVFNGRQYNDYLVTATKIDDGVRIAKLNNLNFHLFIILNESKHILSFKIYDIEKDEIIQHKRTKTKTQFGANGGIAHRINAFIDIGLAKVIQF
jgi:hypothetical protein